LPPAEHTGIGLLLQEFAGDGHEVIRKYFTTDARATPLTIGDTGKGVFRLDGDHALFYVDASGAYVKEPQVLRRVGGSPTSPSPRSLQSSTSGSP
jgi:hypothetical protein